MGMVLILDMCLFELCEQMKSVTGEDLIFFVYFKLIMNYYEFLVQIAFITTLASNKGKDAIQNNLFNI